MNAAVVVAVMLALGFAVSTWSSLRRRVPAAAVRIGLAAASAVLLGLLLFPPAVDHAGGELRVLTPGAAPAADGAGKVVALPGADAPAGVERVPDLATALRRHPGVAEIEVVGNGLPARDREAVRGLRLRFGPAAEPDGIVELAVPARIVAGSLWTLHGRAVGARQIELRDRADARAARSEVDADGRFALEVRSKDAGISRHLLRALDADNGIVEELPLVTDVEAGDRLRLVVLAGAPDGELKHLRRWASDAGLDLVSRIALTRGVDLREGGLRIDAESLRAADLVVIDERAWAALPANEREVLLEALEGGLGLLLRVTGPLPAAVARDWAALGFDISAAELGQQVTLGPTPAGSARPPSLLRRPLAVRSARAAVLLASAQDEPLALWQARGRGRVGLIWLVESYPLLLAGDAARYGTLWSGIVSTLARARGAAPPQWQGTIRIDERATVCGIAAEAFIEAADGARTDLAIDPATPACAAWWPAESGVHVLVDGEARWPFHVLAADEARALAQHETTQATQALAEASVAAPAIHRAPGSRWPWFAAWLVVTALLWWLERRAGGWRQ